MPPTVMSLLILGTHPPPILREGRGTADHQHQIRRIPDIVVHQIIAEMPEGRHQKGTLLEFIHFLSFTLQVWECSENGSNISYPALGNPELGI